MRFSRTRISPSFADIRTPVLRSLRDDSRDGPAILPESRLQAGNWTADGAKHRWASIVQVERRHCQVQFFVRISLVSGGGLARKTSAFGTEEGKLEKDRKGLLNVKQRPQPASNSGDGLSVGFLNC